jgi:hypothetical protein
MNRSALALALVGAAACAAPRERPTTPPASEAPAPAPPIALASGEYLLTADQLYAGAAEVTIGDGAVRLALIGDSADDTVRLVASSAAGSHALWQSSSLDFARFGLFTAYDHAIAIRTSNDTDANQDAVEAHRYRWDAERADVVVDASFVGEPADPGPAWIPSIVRAQIAAQDGELDNDAWWQEAPWSEIGDRWAQEVSWTSLGGERFHITVEEDARGDASLVAHGAAGTTVLVGSDGYGFGRDATRAGVVLVPGDLIAFHVDHVVDGRGTSTLYVLGWDDGQRSLALAWQRIGQRRWR